MLLNKVVLHSVVVLISFVTPTLCQMTAKNAEAQEICLGTMVSFFHMFLSCVETSMPSMKFATDDLKSFVNYPSRTTVGYAPKFTSNRKFFANMISTIEFKNILQRDEEELRRALIKKLKYCDTVVMDQDLLRDMLPYLITSHEGHGMTSQLQGTTSRTRQKTKSSTMTSIPEDLRCIAETKDGPICGFIDKSKEGSYYRFKSIPYAKPPTGCLRFLPPSPIKPWDQIIDCTKNAPESIFLIDKDELGCNEDCLYIEISTPNMQPKEPMPVMFWVGCFAYAFIKDNICDPSLINDQNIVFVRCGFRLGPFGFLSINDYTAPGNCGLKDIVMALKWTQRNINFFGGDPNNVTLFGHSSGGAMVHLMMLSPMATGLFHKAIIQSVSALNNWSLAKNPLQPVWDLANILGIKKSTEVEVVEELRSISAKDILRGFHKMQLDAKAADSDIIDAIFKPCIELDYEGQPAFITKSPPIVMKSGNFNKVPLIIGSNNIEGAVLQYFVEDFYSDYEKYNKNVSLLVPKSLAREDKLSKNIGHQLLKFYLGGEEQLRADTRTQYLQLISDYYFSYYVNRTVRLHSQVAPECPIYYYIINYAGEWSVPKHLDFLNSVGHCAELPFLFKIKNPDTYKGSRDSIITRSRVIKMWTNFAKTGNPTPDDNDPLLQITWDPVENKDKLNYLSIGSELTKGRNPFDERMKFWDTLHQEHAFLRALVYFNDLGVSW